MLKEKVKQQIDKLNEEQLKQVESFIATLQIQAQQSQEPRRFWETATPEEWVRSFQEMVAQFPKTGGSLSDEACDRESIYYGEE
ncbi:unknown protein [Leptolyngbya sp. NIES-3755]|nr:unknown protein [Leptolyngbya sp. NIES-3755]